MVLLNNWCQMCVAQRSRDVSASGLAAAQERRGGQDAQALGGKQRLGEKMINGTYLVPTESGKG